jgi:hypothetical protein
MTQMVMVESKHGTIGSNRKHLWCIWLQLKANMAWLVVITSKYGAFGLIESKHSTISHN